MINDFHTDEAMNTDKQNRFVSAFHEAGHSVVQKLLGIPLIAARLFDDGGGHCELQYTPPSPNDSNRAERTVMGLWGGLLAEELFISPTLSAGFPRDSGYDSDGAQIIALSATYGGADPLEWAFDLRRKARVLMLKNLHHVMAVTTDLLKNGWALPQFGALGAVEPVNAFSRFSA